MLYATQGKFNLAESHYRQAIEIRRVKLGPSHALVAQSLEHYALLLREMGRTAEAQRAQATAASISGQGRPGQPGRGRRRSPQEQAGGQDDRHLGLKSKKTRGRAVRYAAARPFHYGNLSSCLAIEWRDRTGAWVAVTTLWSAGAARARRISGLRPASSPDTLAKCRHLGVWPAPGVTWWCSVAARASSPSKDIPRTWRQNSTKSAATTT